MARRFRTSSHLRYHSEVASTFLDYVMTAPSSFFLLHSAASGDIRLHNCRRCQTSKPRFYARKAERFVSHPISRPDSENDFPPATIFLSLISCLRCRQRANAICKRGTGRSLLLANVQPEADSRRPNPCLRRLAPPRSRILDGLDHVSLLQVPYR
ncbi:hypothetical protein LX32DRAFT_296596 [Colletotrichum zoysiae]|uniref:Uncharacterized protein n=1 Tax=Colletotrichum zoysiae TaxID=1216348 RepID=A0AAD9M6R9_9PEZI|nr:hypothetical protein LX32DRAFT_296596 [Colletotrichum zoysiae]